MGKLKYAVLVVLLALSATACSTSMDILEGATHASGQIHVEGYFTDTEGEVFVCKQPDGSTFCEDQVAEIDA